MAAVVVENRARKNKTIILLDGSRVPPIYPIKQKTSLFFITHQTLKSSLPKYYHHQVLIQISILLLYTQGRLSNDIIVK
jgi:hypothetical protein